MVAAMVASVQVASARLLLLGLRRTVRGRADAARQVLISDMVAKGYTESEVTTMID